MSARTEDGPRVPSLGILAAFPPLFSLLRLALRLVADDGPAGTGGPTRTASSARPARSARPGTDGRPAARNPRPRPRPRPVRMVPATLSIDGRRLRFAVSDNERAHGPEGPGSPPVWAVNVHGYFAGGGMYWRESSHLARDMGWRVVNPSLPGFGGSDPLPWERVNMHEISHQVIELLDHVGAPHAVLLGHSMGGAVAVQLGYDHPERTLGIVYRDGIATPGWKRRKGILVSLLSPVLPDVAGVADLMTAALLDTPDMLIGRRLSSTLRGMWPDARRNIRQMGRTLPVGAMLMSIDMQEELLAVVEQQIPFLPVWGCFDRIVNSKTAAEVSEMVHREIVWVPGGHSWMLPRPQGQVDVLRYLDPGRGFVDDVLSRRSLLLGAGGRQPRLRALR
ncbi:MAG TPA: alpha/beta fold hydrolase [Acidimicrobiales bacterium]|nr:alpha/beta fold hydrolase [Acidimicrobiales bacterium]